MCPAMSSAWAGRLAWTVAPSGTPPVSSAHDTYAILIAVAGDGTQRTVGHVPARRADLAVVDLLARAALLVGRNGGRLAVRGASAQLRGLLNLAGLAELIVEEERRQAEVGEALGVDEVMQSGDRPA